MNFKEIQLLEFAIRRCVTFSNKLVSNKKIEDFYIVYKSNEKLVSFKTYLLSDLPDFEPLDLRLNNNNRLSKEVVTVFRNPGDEITNDFQRVNDSLVDIFKGDSRTFSSQVLNLNIKENVPFALIRLISLIKSLEIDAPTSTQVAYDFKGLNYDEKLDFCLMDPETIFNPVNLTISNETGE